jgi:hypothetical protein
MFQYFYWAQGSWLYFEHWIMLLHLCGCYITVEGNGCCYPTPRPIYSDLLIYCMSLCNFTVSVFNCTVGIVLEIEFSCYLSVAPGQWDVCSLIDILLWHTCMQLIDTDSSPPPPPPVFVCLLVSFFLLKACKVEDCIYLNFILIWLPVAGSDLRICSNRKGDGKKADWLFVISVENWPTNNSQCVGQD